MIFFMQNFKTNLLTTSTRRRNWTRSNTTTATGISNSSAQRGEEVNTPYEVLPDVAILVYKASSNTFL